MHSLKPVGLPPDKRRSSGDEVHHLYGRRKGAVARRGDAVLAPFHQADARNLARNLSGRQDSAETRLGTLAELDLDHFDLLLRRRLGEALGRERSIHVAAAEVAGADLPNDVAAVFAVVRAEPAFARIVRKAAELGAAC